MSLLGDVYAYTLGWPSLAKLHAKLFHLSARAAGLHNFRSSALSGERWLLKHAIGTKPSPVVVDVGANEGQWLAEAASINPRAVIHAFEPQPSLAAQITQNHPSVSVNVAALGAEAGTLELHDYADHPGSQHATLVSGVIDMVHRARAARRQVPVLTLDSYCADHRIAAIDLLKIDVEGFEMEVLRGARRMLEEQRVEVIQFEITHINVLTRRFVADYFAFFGPSYKLFRLLPHGLLPLHQDHHWVTEQFAYQNVVVLKQ